MQKPGIPANEQKRLAHLRALKILDTMPEERFDNITQLAAEVFQMPVSLISFVDENRQWFKSRCGLDIKETEREVSFCGHVVEHGQALVVEDANKDERFADNPLAIADDKPVIFYAGAPLATDEGLILGTLCVIDHQARTFSDAQLSQLMRLAKVVIDELSLRDVFMKSKQTEKKLALKQQQLEERNQKLLQLIDRFKGTRSRLISAEKLATLGLLAAGLGQEATKAINISRKHLLEAHKLSDNEKSAGLISQAMACQDDVRRMIDALCDTTETAGNNELADTDLNETIKHCRNVLMSRFDDKVRFIFEPVQGLPKVRVVESQIFMALLNVLVNAAESTHNRVAIKVTLQSKGEMVLIRITDNGDGMPEETCERATEPFFSSGKDRQHFGLGLSIANGIVRDHGGLLKVHSEANKGSQINIALPFKASSKVVAQHRAADEATLAEDVQELASTGNDE